MKKTMIAALLLGAVALPAAAQQTAKAITMTGLVTSEGVECPAVRGPDGQLYSLAGEGLDLVPGDVVQIEGTFAEMSTCNQGRTITVANIQPIHSAEDSVSFDVDTALRRGGEWLRQGADFVGEKAQQLGETIDREWSEWR